MWEFAFCKGWLFCDFKPVVLFPGCKSSGECWKPVVHTSSLEILIELVCDGAQAYVFLSFLKLPGDSNVQPELSLV